MPGQPPPDGPDDRTVLRALPEDQPDSLSEGHTSTQADIDATPAEKAGGGEAPNRSDTKDVWINHAESQGIDTDGMTKDEVIAAVETA